jgi:hypothetical protein
MGFDCYLWLKVLLNPYHDPAVLPVSLPLPCPAVHSQSLEVVSYDGTDPTWLRQSSSVYVKPTSPGPAVGLLRAQGPAAGQLAWLGCDQQSKATVCM